MGDNAPQDLVVSQKGNTGDGEFVVLRKIDVIDILRTLETAKRKLQAHLTAK